MEIKDILEHKKNVLLDREEVILLINADVTPSMKQTSELISNKFKSSADNIVVEKINGQFGSKQFKVYAKIYNNLKSKEKYETISRKQRKKLIEDAKKTEEQKSKQVEQQTE